MERSSSRLVSAAAAYERAFETLPAANRVALSFEAAIRFARDARRAIEAGAIERRFAATERVRTILKTLETALDRERGGEIAESLGRLYRYLQHRLTLVNTRNDLAIADEVVALLEELARPWRQLATTGERPPVAAEPTRTSGSGRAGFALSA